MTVTRHLRGIMNRTFPYLLTCQQVDQLMVDYFDGALRSRAGRRVRLHMRLCADCRSFSESYTATLRATRAATGSNEDPPGDLAESIIKRLPRRMKSS